MPALPAAPLPAVQAYAELPPDLREPWRREQAPAACESVRNFLRLEIFLNQFRRDFAFRNQIHHAEVFCTDQGLGKERGQLGDPVDHNHWRVEQCGFNCGRAAANDGGIRGGERVVSFSLHNG